jgi:hypothetical protein
MEKYITQLLSDLKTAQSNQPEKVDYKLLYPDHPAAHPEYNDALGHIIEWENAPDQKMDDLFGIKSDAFPPVEKLTRTQIKALIENILELWGSFNIAADLNEAPVELVYKILINYWKTETVQYISEGTMHLEFCHYDVNDCQWGSEYCSCKEFEQDDDDFEMSINDNPRIDITNFDEDDLPF